MGYFGYGYIFGVLFGGVLVDKKGFKFMWIFVGIIWFIFEIGIIFVGYLGVMFFGGFVLVGFVVFCVLFGLVEGFILFIMN